MTGRIVPERAFFSGALQIVDRFFRVQLPICCVVVVVAVPSKSESGFWTVGCMRGAVAM